MARYKQIDPNPNPNFLPVVLSEQLLPGTFEHALNHLLDHKVDLSGLGHREQDARGVEPDLIAKDRERVEALSRDAAKLRRWLKDHPEDRRGAKDSIRKSNRTDNESAKMATDKGVIQGYTGVAAVDSARQIIVEAQAHGSGSEQAVLIPVVEAMRDLIDETSIVTADAGYHSEDNLEELAKLNIEALIADNGMRKRDERFAEQAKHKAKPDRSTTRPPAGRNPTCSGRRTCTTTRKPRFACPAGEFLYQNGSQVVIQGREAVKLTGAKRVCGPCPLRDQCTTSRSWRIMVMRSEQKEAGEDRGASALSP